MMWTNIPPRTRLRPSHLNSFPESQLAEILIKTSRLQNPPWKQRGDQTQFLCCSDSCCSGAFVLEFAEPTLELESSTKCIAWVSFHADWKEHNELWIWDGLSGSRGSDTPACSAGTAQPWQTPQLPARLNPQNQMSEHICFHIQNIQCSNSNKPLEKWNFHK